MRPLLLLFALTGVGHAEDLESRMRLLDHHLPIPGPEAARGKPDEVGVYDLEQIGIAFDVPDAGLPESVRFEVTLAAVRRIDPAVALLALRYDANAVTSGEDELEFMQDDESLVLFLPAPLEPEARITLSIEATLRPDCEDPLTCIEDGEIRHLIDLAWLPLSIEFPLADRFHARFELRGDGEVVPAATGEREPPGEDGGLVSWAFETVYRTFLPVFVLGRLTVGGGGGGTLLVYRPPGADDAVVELMSSILVDVRSAYSMFFQFNVPRVGFAPISDRAGAAVGPQGLVLMPLRFWRTPVAELDETLTRRVLSHELGHQYFFNALAITDPDEAWLSEAFAEWAATRYSEQVTGTTDHYRENYWAYALTVGAGADVPVHSAAANESPQRLEIIYFKGASLLRQLRLQVGRPEFDRAFARYVDTLAGETTSTAEFLAEIRAQGVGRVDDFGAQWLDRAGFPTLEIRTEPARDDRGPLQIEVRQRERHGKKCVL